ncbi:cysteine--tRNA ligase [Methanocella arvoryzae]|uniref:Cysteine--tRNA ligase n=1 Tax=Methanocella arvoryzae (strain DSM 22066 / NBRC 105507 / MRE50) TaxID=351160 RepID=Q0W0K7_METAR|nr:cysteine--tRNA ligase [Methanocella arvoryzae]CAJ38086.1 cysteinyl-tRNA synthetase [Methanocella arvoryzae MRE50]
MSLTSLRFYNTLTQTVEDFQPLDDRKVKMYVCGPTVYDYCHMGHARSYIVFDVIRRHLLYRGYDVTYVQNFTDVDDKILKRAKELNVDPTELSRKFIAAYFEDIDRLNVMRADHYPRVTEFMDPIIGIIKALVDKGYAYESMGSVYFSIDRMVSEVGVLSHQTYDSLKVGARIEVDERKRNPMDFVLWKAAKPGESLSWDSPWGKGRPGWHIECTAMSVKLLGEQIDIHGGGMDLIFPHHESEILQSEAYTGKVPFAKYWIHNGFLLVNKEKMSKSLGNFFLIRDILQKYSPETVRFFILNTNYQGPLDFSDAGLEEAKKSLARIQNTVSDITDRAGKTDQKGSDQDISALIAESKARFDEHMDNNFSTREAIAEIFEFTRTVNRLLRGSFSADEAKQIAGLYDHFSNILGIRWETEQKEDMLADELMKLIIDIRAAVRKKKDYETSDLIRSRLKDLGITLEDTKEGVKVKRQ